MAELNREWEVSVHDVRAMRDSRSPHLLIDVREPHEFAVCRVDGALLAPLRELPARVEEIRDLADGRPVVCLCHHGGRSLRAAAILRQAGIGDARSMAGGIDAWSVLVDPTVPRY